MDKLYFGVNLTDLTELKNMAIFYLPDKSKLIGVYYGENMDENYLVYYLDKKQIDGLEYLFKLIKDKNDLKIRFKIWNKINPNKIKPVHNPTTELNLN